MSASKGQTGSQTFLRAFTRSDRQQEKREFGGLQDGEGFGGGLVSWGCANSTTPHHQHSEQHRALRQRGPLIRQSVTKLVVKSGAHKDVALL